MAQQPPRVINTLYRLGPALITGTVATLYSAYSVEAGEPVSLLLAEPPAKLDSFGRRKLLQPIRNLSAILHPHLLHVREVGLDGKECFIVTDLRGRPLRELLDTEAITLEQALEIVRQLAQGISALHAQGIQEIDLRPERISIEIADQQLTAIVGDVGLRSFLWSLGYRDSAGTLLAQLDPCYAAPEQLKQAGTGQTTDVYTLALTLFEMIAGHPPFTGRSQAETGAMHMNAPTPLLQPRRGVTPSGLQNFIEQAMAKLPALRFKDMNTFCTALAKIQAVFPKGGAVSPDPVTQRRPSSTAFFERPTDVEPTRPRAVPPPSSALYDPAFLDRETQPMAGKEEELKERTLRIPGRARLLIGQSERKKVIPITKLPVILGRADPRRKEKPDIDLAPYDPKRSISRLHARIVREGDLFYLEDMESLNKTWLGELELTPYERQLLRRHETIQLGLLELVFEY